MCEQQRDKKEDASLKRDREEERHVAHQRMCELRGMIVLVCDGNGSRGCSC